MKICVVALIISVRLNRIICCSVDELAKSEAVDFQDGGVGHGISQILGYVWSFYWKIVLKK